MSVTVFLKDYIQSIKVLNEDFDPKQPIDEMFNPKYRQEAIFPEINMANGNFHWFMGLLNKEDFNPKEYEELADRLDGWYLKLRSTTDTIFLRNYATQTLEAIHEGTQKKEKLLRYCSSFARLFRTAIKLNAEVVFG